VLYAQLADHIEALVEQDSTQVRISSGGRQHSVELDRDRIAGAADPAYVLLSSLVNHHALPGGTTVLLSHRVAALPGLVDRISENTDLTVSVLHPAVAGGGALAHADRVRSSGPALSVVTRLPGYDARPPGPVTVPVTPPPDGARYLPTHLVIDGVAQSIGSDPLVLGASEMEDGISVGRSSATVRRLAGQAVLDAPADAGVTLNGEAFDGRTALAPGDRLRLDTSDQEILVVTMAD